MGGWMGGWMDGWMDGWIGDVRMLRNHEVEHHWLTLLNYYLESLEWIHQKVVATWGFSIRSFNIYVCIAYWGEDTKKKYI